MPKSKSVRLSKVLPHMLQCDVTISADTVEKRGYIVTDMPKRYLSKGRWYYLTGSLNVKGEIVSVAFPVRYVEPLGKNHKFITTEKTLRRLGIEGSVNDNVIILGVDNVVLFKFKRFSHATGEPTVAQTNRAQDMVNEWKRQRDVAFRLMEDSYAAYETAAEAYDYTTNRLLYAERHLNKLMGVNPEED